MIPSAPPIHSTHGADPLLTEAQAAHILTLAPSTLQGWRCRGTGPASVKVGRLVRYRLSTVEAWLASRTSAPASAGAVQ